MTLFQPSDEQLQAFEGEFFSHEMSATQRFRADEGKLWLSINGRAWEPLEPTVRDEFIPETHRAYDNRTYQFQRNREETVTAVNASLWRVSNVVFSKRH